MADTDSVLRWVDGYEDRWRDLDAPRLVELFTSDVEYLPEPYAEPVVGLPALEAFWVAESEPGEVFTMSREVVCVSARTAVVRAEVRYGNPVEAEYLDLWVLTFAPDGRVARFEEWPFWPPHGRVPEDRHPA